MTTAEADANEPPDMFSGRVPSKFAGRFPEVVTLEAGKTYGQARPGQLLRGRPA